ncbi:NUDIX hydrolase [Pseudonocardia sp. WMMC193]|uniref:NUDIX hydrolase n=1 Tax=Pseudonocardia sp. WMMC193 TaxID=2911965 RepID=UPI001F29898A|nr:NUDIX hydrolase [Pseudonocardia sp. WMMC193]MCF7553761.1 NUDIX hydrolase [Pseudonocardia sp. WMMC193]
MPDVVVAVITGPEGVLLIRRRDDVPPWVFPGGKVEAGESPAAAARREVLEETGVDVAIAEELGSRIHPTTGASITYVAGVALTSTTTTADPAVVEIRWAPPSALSALIPLATIFPPVRRHLSI